MSDHDSAYTMAYNAMSRRGWRTGSVFQRCEARFGCPPLADGERPKHKCSGRWFGQLEAGFTANGTRRRVTVSAKTKTLAERRMRDKKIELDAAGGSNAKRTVTVARWTGEWLDAIKTKVRPTSFETDKAAAKWIVKTIGHIKLADLTPAHVRQVAAAIRADGGSTSTALRYHGSLGRILKAAALEGYNVPPNVLLVEKPKAAVHDRQAVPTIAVVGLLPHALARPDGSRWAFAFLQGTRQAETLGLTWPMIDLDRGTVAIGWQVKALRYIDRAHPERGFEMPDGYEARHLIGAYHLVRPKSRAGNRVQPLTEWTIAALREWREVAPENPHDLVWPGRTTRAGTWPRNVATDRVEWESVQTSAGIQHPAGRPYGVHEIRHSTATLLMELDVPESVRIAIMGHSSIKVTRGYESVDLEQARIALERATKRLELG